MYIAEAVLSWEDHFPEINTPLNARTCSLNAYPFPSTLQRFHMTEQLPAPLLNAS
jgi:hypothetical protein